jgi:hypothetical protein
MLRKGEIRTATSEWAKTIWRRGPTVVNIAGSFARVGRSDRSALGSLVVRVISAIHNVSNSRR